MKNIITLTKRTNQDKMLYYNRYPGGVQTLSFTNSIQIESNKPIFLLQPNSQAIFILYPGEHINIDDTNSFGNLRLSIENNPIRNNELNLFASLKNNSELQYANILHMWRNPQHLDIEGINDFFNNYLTNFFKYIEEYKGKYKISNEFENGIKSFIKYNVYEAQIIVAELSKKSLSAKRERFFDSVFINNTEMANDDNYIDASNAYINYKAMEKFGVWNINKINPDSLYYFADKNFTGNQKEFFLLNQVSNLINNKKTTENSGLINRFINTCKNTEYKNYIISLINNKKLMNVAGKEVLLFKGNKTKLDFDSLIHSYKNNLIFIDVWASWCAPCRAEMPYSQKIRTLYKDRPIKFLYISMDSEFDKWYVANKIEGLTPYTDSYLLPSSLQKQFASNYNIGSIPRYILFDKNGNIINADAPRPSDPNLKELIDKNL